MFRLRRSCELIVGAILAVWACGAPSDAAARDWSAILEPLVQAHAGKVAVAMKHLPSQESFAFQGDLPVPTASLIKLPVMVEAYRQVQEGKIDLQHMITLQQEDKVPGSGILTDHFSPGAMLSLRDAIHLMIAFSDNTATNLVLDQIGLRSTADTMERMGFPNTKIHSKVFRRESSLFPERSQQFGLGSTTAAEMVRLLEQIQAGTILSRDACDAMLEHLRSCNDRTKLARFLPSDVKVAHKSGAVADTRCDAGIIEAPHGPIVVCVVTTENDDQSWTDQNAAEVLCGKLAKAIYDQFEPVDGLPEKEPELQEGATGKLVSDLQRTLNGRLEPSPELSVDGDFGPATRAAVERFQETHHLPRDGKVTQEFWKRLGPLVTDDPPVPDPDTVNSAQLPREPADQDQGPPLVTSRQWVIADGATGRILWGANFDQPHDPASTTKVMTAYVVLQWAKEDPTRWDERVTISPEADAAPGSSADLRTGETLPLRELIYGLLLPSGNDAAVAIAEHVGAKLLQTDEPTPRVPDSPYARFVREMNRYARDLSLSRSYFTNPHGLTDAHHKMTAGDLVVLSWHAMQDPTFRQWVQTRQRGCQVLGAAGYQRNVMWKNTNRLMQIAGFDGIKTGTTDAAGCCLASQCTRGDRSLLMVVLGASSSDARYADTRNLYRWAFTQPIPPLDAKPSSRPPVIVTNEAWKLHQSSLVWDGHNDLPWEVREKGSGRFDALDIAQPHPELHTDLPRLHLGGVNAQFWSVYVPADTAYDGSALTKTLEQIELVRAMNQRYPEHMELALTAADVERIVGQHKIASLIGVEGGHSIEDSINVLRKLYDLGARYMTLTHSDTLRWADSATDAPQHGGLAPFGEEVVREMNRLGMLVDLSHVSEECMEDALRVSVAPVLFSHSSARTLADHPRNVSDEILRKTAQNGGVVMVNFFSAYVMPSAAKVYAEKNALERSIKAKYGNDKAAVDREMAAWRLQHPLEPGTIHDVVDHIEHVIRVAGIDHVGLGSDYDGVTMLPRQLEDVASYPRITQELLNRGYTPADIRKVLGGNMLRVLREAEQVARQLRSKSP